MRSPQQLRAYHAALTGIYSKQTVGPDRPLSSLSIDIAVDTMSEASKDVFGQGTEEDLTLEHLGYQQGIV